MKKYVLSVLLAMCSVLSADLTTTYDESRNLGLIGPRINSTTGDQYAVNFSYDTVYKSVSSGATSISMSVHDRSQVSSDVWYIAPGVYGAEAGTFTDKTNWATWNFDVLLSSTFMPATGEYILGNIEFQAFSSTWDSYSYQMALVFSELPLYSGAMFDSKNLVFNDLWAGAGFVSPFDCYAEGIYTISVDYAGVSNSIQVQVGNSPVLPVPAVPAPGAVILAAMGTGVIGSFRRRMI